ncbi:UNVERIFIED_CONTAM: Microtubule-associated protein TORTIFOLIA1 [Sesamum latifolium]|uniref:Microtubule-associated protein TORTIFOLIA1 n=1 Tax=Sesamum latifolium TaxID=2727402 RepID=A0AAW2WPG2_9LAMI
MTEALQLWKRIAGKGDVSSTEHKASSHDGEASEPAGSSDRKDLPNLGEKGSEKSEKNSSSGSPPTDSNAKGKGNNISDEAVGMLRKKVPPALTDKELNPEFFHKLETRGSGDLPVEVVVPRRYANPSDSQNEEDPDSNDTDPSRTMLNGQAQGYESIKKGTIGDRIDPNQREFSGIYADFSRNESDGLVNNKGNWLAIQRQLLQLERQQAHLMNMLQDFMGGSHDSMVTLESRVRGLERVVEDMARDLSISTGAKSGRENDGRIHFGERFAAFDGVPSGMRGRGPSWRSDASDAWDFHPYSKNGQMGSRRTAGAGTMDIRSSKSDNEADQVGSRRAWEKGGGPVRFGEGPSARSVWQASKDEATLEAIRVAGEDNGVARNARVAIPEMTAEALGENGTVPERDPVWTSWSNAMDALHVGPVIDQLSDEVATEVLHAVSQLLMEQNFFEMCLYWVQQLADIVIENGPDVLGIPMEVKMEILENLHEAASSLELAEEWDGSPPEQLLLQLASAWDIDPQHLGK